jgi:hypothetical protein
MMMIRHICGAVAGAMLLAGPVAAADFDGSKPLACALIEAIDCVPGNACNKGTAAALNLPQFLRLDFEKKVVTGDRPNEGGKLEAAIMDRADNEKSIILQGVQNDRGWSLDLAKATGRMTVAISGIDEAFILFGACTPVSN